MGVTTPIAEFVVEAAESGVGFERTLTVGRQGLFVGPRRLRELLARHGRRPPPGDLGPSVEPLLRALGAREIVAMDISPYEGADRLHDLNAPVPEELHGRFDLVLDAGSLEHIFNVPVAMRGYMEMVAVGGHLIIAAPANNYCGHGFYQFSPEFFYRALSPENGFAVDRVQMCENDVEFADLAPGMPVPLEIAGPRYGVADAKDVGERVLLQNRRPALVLVQARRTAAVEIFARPPQQSWYEAQWEAGAAPAARGRLPGRLGAGLSPNRKRGLLLDVVPVLLAPLRRLRYARVARSRSLRNRRLYRRR